MECEESRNDKKETEKQGFIYIFNAQCLSKELSTLSSSRSISSTPTQPPPNSCFWTAYSRKTTSCEREERSGGGRQELKPWVQMGQRINRGWWRRGEWQEVGIKGDETHLGENTEKGKSLTEESTQRSESIKAVGGGPTQKIPGDPEETFDDETDTGEKEEWG